MNLRKSMLVLVFAGAAALAGTRLAAAVRGVYCSGYYVVYRRPYCEVCHNTTCTIEYADGSLEFSVSTDWCESCIFSN